MPVWITQGLPLLPPMLWTRANAPEEGGETSLMSNYGIICALEKLAPSSAKHRLAYALKCIYFLPFHTNIPN